MTQAQQRRLHARRVWRRIPIWQHVCMDCGTPIYATGICPSCAEIRQEVSEVTIVAPCCVKVTVPDEATINPGDLR